MTDDTLRAAFEAGSIPAREVARRAEAQGDLTLALRALQVVVRDNPLDRDAWLALAELHEARGDSARADECRRRAGVEPVESPSPVVNDGGGPTDADLLRFCELFSGREGVHARMWRGDDGSHGYSPVEQPLSPDLARLHARGEHTLGIYLVRVDNTVTCCCFDLDVTRRAIQSVVGDAERTRALRAELAAAGLDLYTRLRELGLDPLFVDSGWKGRHYWVFLPRPQPAADVLRWGQAMVAALRPRSTSLSLEFFPKQATVSKDGMGNLVKLPLARHLVSGRRAELLDPDSKPVADPWARLRQVRRVPLPTAPEPLPAVVDPGEPETAPFAPAPGPGDWTEADYEANAEVGPVYRGCAVIRSIVEQALRERRLSRDEAVVLEHSLGHGADGVRGVNYALDRVPGWPADGRMQSPHRGSPISCQRIRQRAAGHARRVGCDCHFEERPGEYPNPLLHRREIHPHKHDPTLDDAVEALARAEDRLRTIRGEVQALRAQVAEKLARVPGRRWAGRGGEWVLVDDDGVADLRFERR